MTRSKSNLFILGILVLGTIPIAHRFLGLLSSFHRIDLQSFLYFFVNPQQQWYYDRLTFLPVLMLVIGFFLSYSSWHYNFFPAFLVTLYSGCMLFLIVIFPSSNRNTIHPRFGLYAQFWYIPTIALGLYGFWVFCQKIFQKRSILLFWSFVITLGTFNIRQILLPTFFKSECMPISSLVHNDVGKVEEYLLANAKPKDVLIGGVYSGYVQWQKKPTFAKIYDYSNNTFRRLGIAPEDFIFSIINQDDSGWIVIDSIRLEVTEHPLRMHTFMWNGIQIEYIGQFTDQFIWRWNKTRYSYN